MRIKNSKTALALVVLSFVILIYTISIVKNEKNLFFDEGVQNALINLFPDNSHSFFKFISEFGDKIGIGAIAIVVIAWLWIRRRDYAGMAAFVLSVGLGNEFNKIIKEAVARPRPSFHEITDADSMSFPSGHAMVGFILYMFIAYLIASGLKNKAQRWIVAAVAFLFVLLIGISRIVLGAHYPSDIIGGYTLGLICLFLWITLYEIVKVRLNKRGKAGQ